MKRRLLIIAIFLLLGAVVNVAVAWLLAYAVVPIETGRFFPRAAVAHVWDARVEDSTTYRLYRGDVFGGLMVEELHLSGGRAVPGASPVRCYIRIVDAGVPMHSLRGERWTFDGKERLFGSRRTASRSGRGLTLVPLLPIWPGFAINTLFYAALLWLLIPGPFVLRRFLRLSRGLCPKCAYRMGESSVCTECGGLLPKRVAT